MHLNCRNDTRIRCAVFGLCLVILPLCGPVCSEEPKPSNPQEKAAASDQKPADTTAKETKDEGKEKPAADGKEAKEKKKPASAKARNQAALEDVINPLRVLFGGPADQAVLAPQQAQRQAPINLNDDDPMVQQFLQQLRPLMNAELGFIRIICSDLTVEQRAKVRVAAESGLKTAARETANEQMRMRQGMAIQVNGAQQANASPAKSLRDAINTILEGTLSSEQMVRFKQESGKRIDDRKKASILSVISLVDARLFLSEEQRLQIEKSILSRWQEDWENWASVVSTYGNRYLPQIPDDCVVPHLNEDQKMVWRGISKINVRNFGMARMRQVQENDDWWGAEAEKPAAEVARPAIRVGF